MVRFWIVAGILCAAGFALFYKYYPQIRPQLRRAVRALVYYADGALGEAAAERLAERGDEVVPVDRTLGNEDDLALLDGVGRGREDARRAARRRRSLRAARRARSAGVVGGRARVPAAAGRALRRRHGHERQDDDDGAARRDLPRRRPSTSRSPGTSASRSRRCARPTGSSASCRRSSSRTSTCFACEVAVLLNLEPDHLDRYDVVRGLPRREAADLRAGAREGRAARPRARRGSSSRPTTRCRPSR